MLDAHYRSSSYFDVWRIEEGIQYFDQFGFDTMGVVRSDPIAIALYAAMKGKHPQRFRGLVHHPVPGDEGGQYLTAQAGWEGATMLGSLELTTSSPTLAAR